MNFKNWLLTEMPITKFQLMGQWEPGAKRAYGYNKQDVGILTNPNAVEKIHKSWSNSKYDFELYFVRTNKARKHVEVGEVTPEWVQENLGENIPKNEDAITVIFTNNTGDEKIPMTSWAIAHRLGHAIRRNQTFDEYLAKEIQRDFIGLLNDVYNVKKTPEYGYRFDYEKELKGLYQAVGTMRSARQMNLRNANEFAYELVAQWLITGDIKFNPLPRDFITRKRMAWGRPNHDKIWTRISDEDWKDWNYQLQNFADKYTYNLDSIFSGLVGKMYVM